MRRKRPGAAGAAYSHALAVLRRPSEATILARSALRRGAHSRLAVLAHARHGALERAGDFVPTDLSEPASSDVKELAWQLAGTRPAVERSLVDLELRYGFSPAMFAKILGLSLARAGERSRQVNDKWEAALDPALMSYLGPGSCAELAGLLSAAGLANGQPLTNSEAQADSEQSSVQTTDVVTIGKLLSVAPVVSGHTEKCAICAERLTQMTSVRALVGNRPLETVPAPVVGTARESKHRVAGPLPPGLEPRRLDWRRLSPVMTYLAVMSVIGAVAFMAVDARDRGDSQNERVARLIETPISAPFLATPSVISGAGAVVTLANNGQQPLDWAVQPTEAWLSVSPSQGRIPPGETATVTVGVNPDSGGQSSILRFTTANGVEQLVRYESDGG